MWSLYKYIHNIVLHLNSCEVNTEYNVEVYSKSFLIFVISSFSFLIFVENDPNGLLKHETTILNYLNNNKCKNIPKQVTKNCFLYII
jgi:hypothetical protein